MTGNDDSILEFLHEKDIALPPAPLHYNLQKAGYDIGYSTVRRRLRVLESHELVKKENEEKGYYGISSKGEKYLSGDLTVADLKGDEK
ncbi:hypothetical protein DMJ13_17330 [halophilic archaeon]|nr:hypothetical protein DMJ13_17330 [halophilic archaeon]